LTLCLLLKHGNLIFMAFNLKKPRPQGQPLGPIKDKKVFGSLLKLVINRI